MWTQNMADMSVGRKGAQGLVVTKRAARLATRPAPVAQPPSHLPSTTYQHRAAPFGSMRACAHNDRGVTPPDLSACLHDECYPPNVGLGSRIHFSKAPRPQHCRRGTNRAATHTSLGASNRVGDDDSVPLLLVYLTYS